MTRVVIQPAGSKGAQAHFASTVDRRVPLSQLNGLLTATEREALSRVVSGIDVPLWGVRTGKNDRNKKLLDKVEPNDLLVFAGRRKVIASAPLLLKLHSVSVAEHFWGRDSEGNTWEHLMFLGDVVNHDISYLRFNAAVGYQPTALLQDFRVLDAGKSASAIELLGYNAGGADAATEQLAGGDWSDDELQSAVAAYLEMVNAHASGTAFSKAAVNQRLRGGLLRSRTKSAVEYRMQNISAVLDKHGFKHLPGYLPATNVGAGVAQRISMALGKSGIELETLSQPTSDASEAKKRGAQVARLGLRKRPPGQKHPKKSTGSTTRYDRDPEVIGWALDRAKGICEACEANAPFLDAGGEPFLEVHHVVPLAHGGPDVVENVAAVCPNCHRRFHLSEDKTDYTEALYVHLSVLVRSVSQPTVEWPRGDTIVGGTL